MIPGLYEIFNTRWGGQTVWVSSDWHFGDSDLRIGHPDRISDDDLVKLLNSKAGRKDVLLCLGDVGNISYVRKLRAGYKVLIKGNHDAGSENYKRKIVKKKFSMDYYQKDEALMEMKRLYPDCKYSIDSGFDFHTPFEYWEITADNGFLTKYMTARSSLVRNLCFLTNRLNRTGLSIFTATTTIIKRRTSITRMFVWMCLAPPL